MAQLERVREYIKGAYGDEPEFLWGDFDAAVWRNERNRKWYAIVQHPRREKILGKAEGDGDEWVSILNVKLELERIEEMVDGVKFFPAYHMNKRYWMTILLDGKASDEEVFALIDRSYEVVDGKG